MPDHTLGRGPEPAQMRYGWLFRFLVGVAATRGRARDLPATAARPCGSRHTNRRGNGDAPAMTVKDVLSCAQHDVEAVP